MGPCLRRSFEDGLRFALAHKAPGGVVSKVPKRVRQRNRPACVAPLHFARVAGDARRFPPPWSVEETDACFVVRDANGQALAYVYFEEELAGRAAAKLLTRDEARRIAANIAELPELLKRRA